MTAGSGEGRTALILGRLDMPTGPATRRQWAGLWVLADRTDVPSARLLQDLPWK